MTWQPIETAPRDGVTFQAWMTDGRSGRRVEQCWEPYARFNEHGAFEIWGRTDYDQEGFYCDYNAEWFPTHWMPLPEPPEDKS